MPLRGAQLLEGLIEFTNGEPGGGDVSCDDTVGELDSLDSASLRVFDVGTWNQLDMISDISTGSSWCKACLACHVNFMIHHIDHSGHRSGRVPSSYSRY